MTFNCSILNLLILLYIWGKFYFLFSQCRYNCQDSLIKILFWFFGGRKIHGKYLLCQGETIWEREQGRWECLRTAIRVRQEYGISTLFNKVLEALNLFQKCVKYKCFTATRVDRSLQLSNSGKAFGGASRFKLSSQYKTCPPPPPLSSS